MNPKRLNRSLKVNAVNALYTKTAKIATDINAKKTSKSPIKY
jgi:hypothetical protein